MATTYAFAIGGAILLALTLTPVLASKLIPAQTRGEGQLRDARAAPRLQPALRLGAQARQDRGALRARARSLVLRTLFPLLGGEFMPKLEEGNFWIRATLPTSISLEQSAKYVGPDARHPARLPERRQRAVQRGEPQAPRGHRRSSRSSVAPTTAPTSPASTTSSSSRRSSPSTSGRAGSRRRSSPTSSRRSSPRRSRASSSTSRR